MDFLIIAPRTFQSPGKQRSLVVSRLFNPHNLMQWCCSYCADPFFLALK